MIARVFAAAHLTVHAGGSEMLRQCRTEQQMIDAETGVAREGVSEITSRTYKFAHPDAKPAATSGHLGGAAGKRGK
jgi:hypothetical protein